MKFIKKLSNTYKIYIVGGPAIALTIALLFFLIYPLYTKNVELKESIYGKRVQLASFQQQRENIEQTRKEYNSIKADIDSISKIFIDEENVLGLISSLEEIAISKDIIQSISLGTFTTNGSTRELNFKIIVQGSWASTLAYIATLEQLDYYIIISDIVYDSNENRTEVSIDAIVYGITQ